MQAVSGTRIAAMFPLGGVLFPSAVLPLHVFEPRYRQLVDDVLASDREFGVVLIERGSEVGGGDQRGDLGTIAQVLDAEQFDDGRWGLTTVGTRRFRVLEWLPDDPYPRARIEELREPPGRVDQRDATERAGELLRDVFALRGEISGRPFAGTIDLSDDPVLASHQISALSPLGPFDRQRLLNAPDADQRLALLAELLVDHIALLTAHRDSR